MLAVTKLMISSMVWSYELDRMKTFQECWRWNFRNSTLWRCHNLVPRRYLHGISPMFFLRRGRAPTISTIEVRPTTLSAVPHETGIFAVSKGT